MEYISGKKLSSKKIKKRIRVFIKKLWMDKKRKENVWYELRMSSFFKVSWKDTKIYSIFAFRNVSWYKLRMSSFFKASWKETKSIVYLLLEMFLKITEEMLVNILYLKSLLHFKLFLYIISYSIINKNLANGS